jgi:LysM repeat protein
MWPGLVRMVILALAGAAISGCSLFDTETAAKANAAAAALPPAGRAAFYVRVERGQSLDQLAHQYRVPKQRIITANNLAPPYRVVPGSQLEIPLEGLRRSARPSPSKSTKPNKAIAGWLPKKKGAATAQAKVKRRAPETVSSGPA